MTQLTPEVIEQRLKRAIKKIYACNVKYSEKVGMEDEQELGVPASELEIENFIKKIGAIPNTYKFFLRLHNGYKYFSSSEAHLLSIEDHEKKWVADSIEQHLSCFININEIIPDIENPFKIGFLIDLGDNRAFAIIDQTLIDANGEMKVKRYHVSDSEPIVYDNFLEYIEGAANCLEKQIAD